MSYNKLRFYTYLATFQCYAGKLKKARESIKVALDLAATLKRPKSPLRVFGMGPEPESAEKYGKPHQAIFCKWWFWLHLNLWKKMMNYFLSINPNGLLHFCVDCFRGTFHSCTSDRSRKVQNETFGNSVLIFYSSSFEWWKEICDFWGFT